MSELRDDVLTARALAPDYFRNPRDYFWRWVEKGDVVEWQSGDASTICYREELARVLRGLAEQGLPPLAPVLLLLAACAATETDLGNRRSFFESQWQRLPAAPDDPSEAVLQEQTAHALLFMQVVSALPAPLRQAAAKLHLFREVFGAQAPQVSAGLVSALLDEWESGRSEKVLHFSRHPITRRVFLHELACLAQALHRFPTTDALARHLRTGLSQPPAPLPPAPDLAPDLPGPAAADLLDQLAQDPRTAGLARLAQQVGAALRVPLHARDASAQPIGGVADITNKGDFDRLLLSELAHDDLVLTARLVNNEALYLRREAPPRPEVRPRFILLDTTLRMWGVPRVFALAAALAWARTARQARPPVPVAAVALGGSQFSPLNLETFDGVVAALGLLDAAPHGGPALQAFAQVKPASAAPDCLLITDATLLHQPDFVQALAGASAALRFLLTVDRSGELRLYEYQHGHRTLASTARYDLEELLFKPPAPGRLLSFRAPTDAPAFLQHVPAPLYFPVVGLRLSIKDTFYVKAIGVVSVADQRRVLFWPDRKTGARELLPVIESGAYYFGSDEVSEVYVLVSGRRLLRIYALLTGTGEVRVVDLADEVGQPTEALPAVFRAGCFHIQWAEGTLVFDCRTWAVRERRNSIFPTPTPSPFRPDFGPVKRHVNNGYNVLRRVTWLGIAADDNALVVEGHKLVVASDPRQLTHKLRLLSKRLSTSDEQRCRSIVRAEPKPLTLSPNEDLRFQRFIWPDGSEAILDPRGLLHLRSAAAHVPEITLLLVLGQPSAAWAADGAVCGSPYFTGPAPAQLLPVPEFLRHYLEPFIANLGA